MEQSKKLINPDNLTKAYVSVPMEGIPNMNLDIAVNAYRVLKEKGYWVFIPHWIAKAVDRAVPNAKYRHYLGYDISILSRCDIMVLLPGWDKSKGCCEELRFAFMHNIPVYLLLDNELVEFGTINLCSICGFKPDNNLTQQFLNDIKKENDRVPLIFVLIVYFLSAAGVVGLINLILNLIK